jgi:tetratricopeptide (TPR) repeat protein
MLNTSVMTCAVAAAIAALALNGCAQTPVERAGNEWTGASVMIAQPADSGVDIESELLFRLLVAEMALQADDYDQASAYYLEAARLSADPAVAERATRTALFGHQRGRALAAAGRWLELVPGSLDAMQTMAVLQVAEGDAEAAAAQLSKILEERGVEEGFRLVASLLAQSENGDTALDTLQRLVRAYPGESVGWQAHAELAMRFEAFDLAYEIARDGMQRFPGAASLRLILARAAAELNDPNAALEALAAAVKAHPERRDVRLAYARALIDLGDFDRVRPEFDRLLRLAPDDVDLLLTTALLSLEAGQFGLARDYLRRLLDTGQRSDDAWYYLGRLHERDGDLQAAIRSYAAVGPGDHYTDARLRNARLTAQLEGLDVARPLFARMQNDPDEETALRAYLAEANVLREQRQLEAALLRLSRGLIQFPGSVDLLYARGLVHERADDIAAAETDFRSILDQDPDNVSALNALGYTLADRTQRYEEAYALIVRAYAQRPDDAAITDSYGWVLYRLGRLDEAVVKLREAYALFPDGEIASNLAVVLWEIGEREESLAILDEALEREPDHERLQRVRRQLVD